MPNRPLTAAGRERVAAAIAGGNTIEAIKLYRQDTLASLKDAKEAVEAMAAGRSAGTVVPMSGDHPVFLALYGGKKIEAIRQYRLAHRVELRQAKEAVEAIDAELRRTAPERFSAPAAESGGSGLRVVVVLMLLAAAAAAAWHYLR